MKIILTILRVLRNKFNLPRQDFQIIIVKYQNLYRITEKTKKKNILQVIKQKIF